ncbi:His-Xaa-Ser system radical SAM maturase HxsC [Mycobacterium paragordonae]|uniref:His-Xaa-Ser system radical SAM maturase HxsC n=1 Tax=Mycobacterium paragordonae TaxID=1389713 RepID=A0AAJ1W400_9MYCO|nr:His-Xaa-Ser system radical SAM maturase HxsC [Mycobacterium paragordonae]MDP7736491.1 His-Xaa-Ser system radical SAM maturase HxsC [Mycobacterium paragordonae]
MKPLVLAGRWLAADLGDLDSRQRPWRLRSATSFPSDNRDAALIADHDDWALAHSRGFRLAVGSAARPAGISLNYVRVPGGFAELGEGDVLAIQPRSGRVQALYRRSSRHNFFLVTERCNNYCLMCSQPPKKVDDGWVIDLIAETLPLVDPATPALTFTGGEPLTEWRKFIGLLELTRNLLPNTAVHVLTNGRAFATADITNAWARVDHPKLSVGIPIYAAVDSLHDYVVQAKGAFDETVLGVLRLKDRRQRVEIRVVLHALTAPRLRETCTWIARNLSFVDHVALMGMEHTGFAIANDDKLWVDPLDYQEHLKAGVDVLSTAGVNVSIYNLPLCVLDPGVRPFAVQSISDWKNTYVEECEGCSARGECAGFFSTGRPRLSRGIAAI